MAEMSKEFYYIFLALQNIIFFSKQGSTPIPFQATELQSSVPRDQDHGGRSGEGGPKLPNLTFKLESSADRTQILGFLGKGTSNEKIVRYYRPKLVKKSHKERPP